MGSNSSVNKPETVTKGSDINELVHTNNIKEIVSTNYSKSEKESGFDMATNTANIETSKVMSNQSNEGAKGEDSELSADQNMLIHKCRVQLQQFVHQGKDSLKVVDDKIGRNGGSNERNTTSHNKEKVNLERLSKNLASAYTKYEGNVSVKALSRFQEKLGDVIAETGAAEEFCVYVINALNEMMESKSSDITVTLTLTIVLMNLGNYTDGSVCLCQTIAANSSYLEACTRFLALKGICERIKGINSLTCDDPGNEFLDSLLTPLHNIASRDELASSMRDIGFTNELKLHLSNDKRDIWMQALAILAALVTEDECDIIQSNHKRVEELLSVLEHGLEEEELRYEGWSCREIAHTVRLLARNDANKRMLVEMGAFKTLVALAKTEEKEEKMESIQSIWVLCFDKDNKREAVNTEELGIVDLLTDLQGHKDKDIARASKNVLWTLRDALATSTIKRYREQAYKDKHSADSNHSSQQNDGASNACETQKSKAKGHVLDPSEKLPNGLKERKHIMISYNKYSREILMKIKAEICRHGYTVWMDVDNISGSTLDAMACAVEEAEIILICMSQMYKDSNNCRAEAEYAFKLNKKIIPLCMDMNYKPDGWLGIMIGTKLFFDFSGKYKFSDKMGDLQNEIDRMYPDSFLKVQPIKEERLQAVVVVDGVDAAAPAGHQRSPTEYASARQSNPGIACNLTREFIDSWYKTHLLTGRSGLGKTCGR
ncbi:uncharacterized protein LOC128234333 isoform X2 [Mya arenaria]|uniref:uncharacterized protein LOC128234333 isoform X2 n=1 Tax=Mya arenaria TaxID=6604 RepID=UPI0022E2A8C4|nr:uncharacterized protein LOC128234333 isoform X2 [Mya arenaria]